MNTRTFHRRSGLRVRGLCIAFIATFAGFGPSLASAQSGSL